MKINQFYCLIDKILGEGNFGKVCLAAVSLNDPIRDESQLDKDDFESAGGGSGLTRHRLHFSIRGRGGGQNSQNKSGSDLALNDFNQPLLVKGSRQAAVKMVKGKW
jgi:hypothetical protein